MPRHFLWHAAQMPDYIIVDTGMSDFNAEDLIRKLRKMDRNSKTKIIACMTQVDLVAMTRAKRAGADDFMLKPFDRKSTARSIPRHGTRRRLKQSSCNWLQAAGLELRTMLEKPDAPNSLMADRHGSIIKRSQRK